MIVSCQRSVAKFPVSGPWPSGALGRRRVADFRAYGRVITRQATRLLRVPISGSSSLSHAPAAKSRLLGMLDISSPTGTMSITQ